MIRTAITCCALLLSGRLAAAHEEVIHHSPHPAESRKPHDTTPHQPHAVTSHSKPQKPPSHGKTVQAKHPKVAKH